MVEVVQVPVQCITIKLDGDDFLDCRVRNAQCLLQTLQNALAVLMRVLGIDGQLRGIKTLQ